MTPWRTGRSGLTGKGVELLDLHQARAMFHVVEGIAKSVQRSQTQLPPQSRARTTDRLASNPSMLVPVSVCNSLWRGGNHGEA